MKRFLFLTACLFLIHAGANAQYSRYIITLRNKNGAPYTLANPSQYLSVKAQARRSRQNIALDSTDLPIPPAYIDSIRAIKNVQIINKSNWLNQLCISTTDPAAIVAINRLSFVKTTTPAANRFLPPRLAEPQTIDEGVIVSSRLNKNNSALADKFSYGNSFNQVHIHNGEYLHNQGFTGEGLTIAIFDAGFFGYKTNPVFDSIRLKNRVLGEWDFVAGEQSVNEDDTHGMYCFSIMAANRPGSMIGSSPGAAFYLFRTEDTRSEYPVEEQNWTAAAELADSLGVDMISSSLGYADFDDPDFDYTHLQRDGNTSIVSRAADLAAKKGIIVMNSAGNTGTNTNEGKFVLCPADADSVVAVGAVDANGVIAGFSSWGPNGAGKLKPAIVSLGVAATIAGTDGNPATGNGTSYANPNIAGLIACFWQAFPEAGNMAIIEAVQRSANRFNESGDRYGHGIPDFKKAFAILVRKNFKGSISSDKCVTTFNWSGKDDQHMRYEIERKSGTDTGYTKIATITGKSATFTTNSYSYRDSLKTVIPTVFRYRLKQILPGDSALVLIDSSIVVASSCNIDNRFYISPNPFKNSIVVTLNSIEILPKMSIALYNMQGQRLYYIELAKPATPYSHSIPALPLPSGNYIITIRDNRRIIFSGQVVK